MRIVTAGLWLSLLVAGCSRPAPVEEIALSPGDRSDDLAPAAPAADDWPWWRGPTLDGKSAGGHPPVTWSENENVVWRTEVPGRGHASPIVWQERLFLATADEDAQSQSLVSFDRATGKLLWNKVIHQGGLMHRHHKNSSASATPAADGRHVYTAFINRAGLWVTATDFEGEAVWQTQAGPFASQHGYGASPVLYKSLVIVAGDNAGPGYLAALERRTGRIVWRVGRTDQPSYSTPIVGQVAGRPQLLLSGASTVSSYDPDTGRRLWYCRGPTQVTASTMAFGGDLVYASGGYPDMELLAIRADGSDDVSDTHIVWRTGEGVTYVPSPLMDDGRLYVVNDQGIASCFDARTGELVWKQRLGGNFSASPVLAGGNVYASDEEGTTVVFKAGAKYEFVAKNPLGGGHFATPAISGDRIYLRAGRFLYCIGQPAAG